MSQYHFKLAHNIYEQDSKATILHTFKRGLGGATEL